MVVFENPDFADLPLPVAALFAAASESSFFAQAEWYAIMVRHALETGTQVRLFTDADVPAAGLIFCTDGARRLHGLSNAYSLEYEPIARRGSEGCKAILRLVEAVAREEPGLEAIRFTALDPDAPYYAALLDGLRAARWLVKPFFDSGTWYEDTAGVEFCRYFADRPAILRNTYRRKAKRVRDLEYFFSDNGTDLEELIADYETIYGRSWKPSERFPALVPALIRIASATGALRMGVIRIDGVPAAAQFWLVWRGRAVIYKLAHDERFDKMSLGTLLTMRMVERVLNNDHPLEINFGRGDDPYKRLWLPRRRERWGLLAANPRSWHGVGLGLRLVASQVRDRLLSQRASTAVRSCAS